MSKKRGLSAEEKRQRMMEIFKEKKDFFSLKDMEKIAPKEKGIVMQSVKEVLQSLVDDGMVDTDKIGTSIYFWAFPSKLLQQRRCKLRGLQEKIDEQEDKLAAAKVSVEKAKAGKENSDLRDAVLARLEVATTENADLTTQLTKLRNNDAGNVEEMKKQIEMSKQAVNRWTDNIYSIQSWCKQKFSIEEAVLNKQFGIPEDLDYVD